MALDESTDISDTSQLLVMARNVYEEFNISEELFRCIWLHGSTSGINVFNLTLITFYLVLLQIHHMRMYNNLIINFFFNFEILNKTFKNNN